MLPNSLEPSFSTYSLQIYCIGLFGPRTFYLLGLGLKLRPYIAYFLFFLFYLIYFAYLFGFDFGFFCVCVLNLRVLERGVWLIFLGIRENILVFFLLVLNECIYFLSSYGCNKFLLF